MGINRKNRTELKNYFLENKIPTEKQYADFIDTSLNMAEDCIVKKEGHSLAIQSEGEQVDAQEILSLYTSFADSQPGWSINLNPRVDPLISTSNQPGFNIEDITGQSRLFINSSNGNIGLGTIEPEVRLHVKGPDAEIRVSNTDESTGSKLCLHGIEDRNWAIAVKQDGGKLKFSSGDGVSAVWFGGDGSLEAEGGLIFGNNRSDHIESEGAIYRKGGQTYLSGDNNISFRVPGSTEEKIHFKTGVGRVMIGGTGPQAPLSIKGSGKDETPDGAMHLTDGSILFGGTNHSDNDHLTAIISAGTQVSDSLNIIGMGSTPDTRKVEVFAEGGMTVHGHIKTTKPVAFAVYIRFNNQSGTINKLNFGWVSKNLGKGFDASEDCFRAPVTGIYLFSITLRAVDGFVRWFLVRKRGSSSEPINAGNGVEAKQRSELVASASAGKNYSRTIIAHLQEGDEVFVRQEEGGKCGAFRSSFSGALVQALA